MVRYEPGLSVRSDPFRFGLDTFTIRGMTGNRVAVEVDGIPSAPGFCDRQLLGLRPRLLDLAFVQRVEILRGPASSLYGSDAIGGVVAMSTLTPDALLDRRYGRGPAQRSGLRQQRRRLARGRDRRGPDRAGRRAAGIRAPARQRSSTPRPDVPPDPRDYDADSMLATAQFDSMPGGPLTVTAEGGRLHQTTDVNAWELLAGSRFANTVVLSGDDSGGRFRTSVAQELGATSAYDSANWIAYWQGTDTRQDTYEQRQAVARPRAPPLAARPPVPLRGTRARRGVHGREGLRARRPRSRRRLRARDLRDPHGGDEERHADRTSRPAPRPRPSSARPTRCVTSRTPT